MEHYLTIKSNEVLIRATIQWPLKSLCSAEEASHKKNTYNRIPCMWNVQNGPIYRDRKKISGCLWLGDFRGNVDGLLMVTRFLIEVIKMFKNWLWWWVPNSVNILKTIEMYALNGWIIWYTSYSLVKQFFFNILQAERKISELEGLRCTKEWWAKMMISMWLNSKRNDCITQS